MSAVVDDEQAAEAANRARNATSSRLLRSLLTFRTGKVCHSAVDRFGRRDLPVGQRLGQLGAIGGHVGELDVVVASDHVVEPGDLDRSVVVAGIE